MSLFAAAGRDLARRRISMLGQGYGQEVYRQDSRALHMGDEVTNGLEECTKVRRDAMGCDTLCDCGLAGY